MGRRVRWGGKVGGGGAGALLRGAGARLAAGGLGRWLREASEAREVAPPG